MAKRVLAPVPRPITSNLSAAAYSALLIYLPIHIFTNSTAPSDPSQPILSFGPSELDFEYVKFQLTRFPWRSGLLYLGLVNTVTFHAVEGLRVIRRTWFRRTSEKRSKTSPAVFVGLIAAPILSGIYFMSQEPLMAFSSMIPRYEAALRQSFWFRLNIA